MLLLVPACLFLATGATALVCSPTEYSAIAPPVDTATPFPINNLVTCAGDLAYEAATTVSPDAHNVTATEARAACHLECLKLSNCVGVKITSYAPSVSCEIYTDGNRELYVSGIGGNLYMRLHTTDVLIDFRCPTFAYRGTEVYVDIQMENAKSTNATLYWYKGELRLLVGAHVTALHATHGPVTSLTPHITFTHDPVDTTLSTVLVLIIVAVMALVAVLTCTYGNTTYHPQLVYPASAACKCAPGSNQRCQCCK